MTKKVEHHRHLEIKSHDLTNASTSPLTEPTKTDKLEKIMKNTEDISKFKGTKRLSKDFGAKRKFEPKRKDSNQQSKPRVKKTNPLIMERYPSVIINDIVE